jgi:hypothetical protein
MATYLMEDGWLLDNCTQPMVSLLCRNPCCAICIINFEILPPNSTRGVIPSAQYPAGTCSYLQACCWYF